MKTIKKRDPTNKNLWSEWRQNNFEFFQEFLKNENADKILFDIGAGESHFRELTGRFKYVKRIDFYPYDLVDVVTDITKPLPFENECCDIVFMSNVLEHIPNPQKLLEECFRILKRGGVYYWYGAFYYQSSPRTIRFSSLHAFYDQKNA